MSRTVRRLLSDKKLERKKSRKLQALKKSYPIGSLVEWSQWSGILGGPKKMTLGLVVDYSVASGDPLKVVIQAAGTLCAVNPGLITSVWKPYRRLEV